MNCTNNAPTFQLKKLKKKKTRQENHVLEIFTSLIPHRENGQWTVQQDITCTYITYTYIGTT